MKKPTWDINNKDFFSDDNMDAIAEDATFSDWEAGPNENPNRVTRPRPVGDNTFTPWIDTPLIEGADND